MIVYPRKRLDFKYIDLLIALGYCLNPLLDRNQISYSIKKLWPNGNVLIGLSVRTIFDALLSELNFHKGSEVIMTGINIPDMVHIVQTHDLKVVPIDLDMSTLQIKPGVIEQALSDRTVMVVVGHLFGSRMEMDIVYEALANRPEIKIVEDSAQAFQGMSQHLLYPRTTISMFSFGSIKSVSALGCSVALTLDHNLYKKLESRLKDYNKSSRIKFMSKVIKYFFLKTLSFPLFYGMYIFFCRLFRIDYDALIISAVRNFKLSDLFRLIRQSPCTSQLQFLKYRLSTMNKNHLLGRINAGNYVRERLNRDSNIHGLFNETHTYWLFPIKSKNKQKIVSKLRSNGFDATFNSSQLNPIEATGENQLTPNECITYMVNTVYLPVYESIPEKKFDILISIVNQTANFQK